VHITLHQYQKYDPSKGRSTEDVRYRVVKLVNTTRPLIGEHITEPDVFDLLARGVRVVIDVKHKGR